MFDPQKPHIYINSSFFFSFGDMCRYVVYIIISMYLKKKIIIKKGGWFYFYFFLSLFFLQKVER